ncbi:unnamed protein product [Ceutorhynchus assimilis]|uniref:Uncharacterized protein n=1 Tax=Ceutorhynchus assimilis TaxID=467358 RepID=A0A9N9MKU1_9CUCU|nr:unnamed protein product [Ceutorhynchus assimilis]
MSSLSQDPSKMDHHYQCSESSDHGLLTHTHTCTCCRDCIETPESPKTENLHPHCIAKSTAHHQHHVINLAHPHLQTSHVHLGHHHVPSSPKNGNQAAKLQGSCTCHIKAENETDDRSSIEPTPQTRKLDEDRIEVSPLPPALPPRPPPRPRYDGTNSLNSRYRPRICKYIFFSITHDIIYYIPSNLM